jgi:predicted MFS family arabinose efflux permease
VSVPRAARAQYFAACTGAGISFATFGLFTSLAPRFLAGTLHHSSRALAGAAACAVFGSAVVAQVLSASRSRRELLLGGVAIVPLGLTLDVLAVWLPEPSLDLFLLGGVLGGVGGGLLFKGGVATVSAIAAEEHRAEALAGLFLIGYVGLAVPVIGLGILTEELSVRVSLLFFAGLLGSGVAAAAPALLRRRDPLRT